MKKNKKSKNNKKWGVYSLLIILIGIFLFPQTAYLSSITSEKIIELTNKERVKNGFTPLTANQLLTKAAYEKGKEIIKNQTFNHTINGQKFSVWIKNVGYKYIYAGENLAIDFSTSEGVVRAWLNSPTHKENLLNPNFQEIGVAIIKDRFNDHNTILVVQIFGSPLKNYVLPTIKTSKIKQNNFTSEINPKTNNLKSTNIKTENLLTHTTYYSFLSAKQNNKNFLFKQKPPSNIAQYNKNSLLNFAFLLFTPFIIIVMIFTAFNLFYNIYSQLKTTTIVKQ